MEDTSNKKMTGSLVSVVTPTYNAARFISNTIESVLNQTYPHWEMIMIDDGSTDGTVEIIKAYAGKDPRIRVIIFSENKGPAEARNAGITEAKGQYISFLDGDDMWHPEKIERQKAFMESKKIAFSFTDYQPIDEAGKERGKPTKIPKKRTYRQLLKSNEIGCLTVMIDRNQTGEFLMPSYRTRQDYALWLYLTKKGFDAYGLQVPLAQYRNVKHSLSSNKSKMALQNWTIYREYENLNLLSSIWYFSHYAMIKSYKALKARFDK